MEQKLSSSHRRGNLSGSDSDSDPEREFSGDDDRNHKHRRREIRPQSSELDAPQSVSSRPYNNRNKSFQNGNSFRGNGSRVNGGLKNNNFTSSENESFKPDRRHFDASMFSRPQMDVNRRVGFGKKQTYVGDSGFARGRGKESWNPHAPRFGSMEFSQAANHGSVSSNIFAGRGLSSVASVHTAPWNPYGLLPGMPGGGLDAVHSIGVNISLRPPMNPSSSGIIRQKCRDFEERGFCLRGDMCPMEHGVNRIVVDDVQSLSKFNLPVSIPGGNGIGVGGGSGPLPAGTASASFSVNSTKTLRKMGKSKTARKGTNSDAVENISGAAAGGNDFYDPDQPLLNKNVPESSAALSQPCSPYIREEPILDVDLSLTNPDEVHNNSGIYPLSGSAGSSVVKHSLTHSSLGGLPSGSSRSDQKGMKGHSSNNQKPLKAMRTIFVNGIPQKDNNIEALRSHFQKFGEIIDIYIPLKGEKAFVQFSTREEAESALKAPDAVMGNRFINLWWANRDNIPDHGTSSGNNPYMGPGLGPGPGPGPGPTQVSFNSKGISNQLSAPKVNTTHAPTSIPKIGVVSVSRTQNTMPVHAKHATTAGVVTPAPMKKLENLEVLKEELRKKQEMLDQKRNEFKRQLDKLEKQKQAAGVKSELSSEQPPKRQKVAMATDVAKRLTPKSADISTPVTLSEAKEVAEKETLSNKPLVKETMDVDSASQNNVLQKETIPQPVKDSESAAKHIDDNVAIPMVEVRPSKYDEENARDSQTAKENVLKHEKQLSEGEVYAEKEDGKKSHIEDSVKPLDDQLYQEDDEREYDKRLSDDEMRSSDEEHPSNSPDDNMDEEHVVEEVEEKKFEGQSSEDAVL